MSITKLSILLCAVGAIGFASGALTGIIIEHNAKEPLTTVIIPKGATATIPVPVSYDEHMRRRFCGDEHIPVGEASKVLEYAEQHKIVCAQGGVL